MMKIASKLFGDFSSKITEINERYKNPRIKMTPLIRGVLFALRLYLLLLVALVGYKFYTIVAKGA